MGFIINFYIIFGTNLLTQGPVQIAVFFAHFSVSQKRNIKRNPNGMKPSRGSFLEQTQSRRLGVDVKKEARRPRGRRARPRGVGAPPTLVGQGVGPLQLILSPVFFIIPCYYIICLGCLMGFIIHLYIIFGTNLLTEGPLQIAVFLPILVFHRRGISNGIQME